MGKHSGGKRDGGVARFLGGSAGTGGISVSPGLTQPGRGLERHCFASRGFGGPLGNAAAARAGFSGVVQRKLGSEWRADRGVVLRGCPWISDGPWGGVHLGHFSVGRCLLEAVVAGVAHEAAVPTQRTRSFLFCSVWPTARLAHLDVGGFGRWSTADASLFGPDICLWRGGGGSCYLQLRVEAGGVAIGSGYPIGSVAGFSCHRPRSWKARGGG